MPPLILHSKLFTAIKKSQLFGKPKPKNGLLSEYFDRLALRF
jgi:hypothetical protein